MIINISSHIWKNSFDDLLHEINRDISKNIFVKEIDYGVPSHS